MTINGALLAEITRIPRGLSYRAPDRDPRQEARAVPHAHDDHAQRLRAACRGYPWLLSWSRAMLRFRTFTRGSPRNPSTRSRVYLPTSACTVATGSCRAVATRFTCRSAFCG